MAATDLLDERGCERLLFRYCRLIDQGSASAVPELFTPPAVTTPGGGAVRVPKLSGGGRDSCS